MLASIIKAIRLQYINVSNKHVVHLKLTQCYFPGGSDSKASCLQCGRPGFDPWVRKILWRRKWQPTPVLFPKKSHGQRSLAGYSPLGRKELDTTEWIHFRRWTSLVAQRLKRLPALRETWVQSLGWEDPLEKEMTTHSSILAWRIPWTEEPGGLQSTGSQRVGHDWATSLSLRRWTSSRWWT